MEKVQLRQQQLDQLANISVDNRIKQSMLLYQQLFNSSEWRAATTIGVTLSNELEVATRPIIEQAWLEGKQVAIPLTLPKRQMTFVNYTKATRLSLSTFHVWEPAPDAPRLEPKQIDLMVVPGLAYALDTHARVGFGGGYYDRYLARYAGHKVALALSPMAFPTATWQVAEFDVLLDTIITVKESLN